MITFTVKDRNERDVWLETQVTVDAPYAIDRYREAKRQVRAALTAASTTFPRSWPRDLCDWCRFERQGSDGYFVVRVPGAVGQRVLAWQEQRQRMSADRMDNHAPADSDTRRGVERMYR